MNEQKKLLILWIVFGFVFIKSIDSALYLISELFLSVELIFNVPVDILIYSHPTIIIVIHLTTLFFIVKSLNINSEIKEGFLIQFPKWKFILLSITAITLIPITNYFKAYYISPLWMKYMDIHNLTRIEYLSSYSLLSASYTLLDFVIYLWLIVSFFILIKKLK
jgi:hypothetical protein